MRRSKGDADYNSWDEDEPSPEPSQHTKTLKDSESKKCLPPSDDEGMVVKPTCSCRQCTHWTESNDWTTTEFEGCKKTTPKEKRSKPLLRSEKHPGRQPKISAFKANDLTKVEKQAIFRTLVHGEIIPAPVKNFTDTYFTTDIQKSLAELNYKYSLPLQAFAWPAIFRQLNVCMIGEQGSGKTMSYLPAVCTFSVSEDEKYEEFAKYKGPLVLIICPNTKQCEEIYDLTKKIFSNSYRKPKIAVVTYPLTHVSYMDILITIPDSLIQCLQDRLFNLKRLCHLVLEDGSTLLKSFESSIYKTLVVVDEMLEHRPSNHKVQFILTSTKWSSDLEKLCKLMFISPLICISNYLEAALYGGIKFGIKILQPKNKKVYLRDILRGKSHLYKTVVFCNDEEVNEISEYLDQQNIATIGLSDNASKEEIEMKENEWNCTRGGKYKVLLCTDFVFETLLNVNDALWLVHYSFPNTWTRFTKRFSAMSSNYDNLWKQNEESVQCETFVVVDDSCEEQMPKILNLLKRLGKLPDNFKQIEQAYKLKNENEKLTDGANLCNKLKLFGKCPDQLCEDRHLVKKEVDISEDLPKKGKISFRILNMKDVTQYTVQLLEHTDLNGSVHMINNDNLKDPLVISKTEKILPKNLQVGKFYVHLDSTTDGEVYNLCHVLTINKDTVEVKLMSGFTLHTIKKNVFEVPSYLKIVDVYICNLVPPFRDEYFSGRSFHVTETSLQGKNYKNLVLTGDIFLQLDRTFWLGNVVESFRVDGIDVIRFDLTKHLVNLKVVEKFPNQVTLLHKFCSKCGIALPSYIRRSAKKPAKVVEIEPQTAFLDDNVNEVNFISAVSPDEFYVRLTKFYPLLENLEKDIQTEVKTEILDKNLNVEIGNYYLALNPQVRNSYFRAKVLKVEHDKALCFYVDYGDEAIVDIKTLKILPSKFITKLPFQAIQCRLYGLNPIFENWTDEATDVLYRYTCEPESDIFRSLYVEVRAKDDGDIVRAKTKYSILLKDGYGDNNVLINQLLLDCGLATSIFDKMDDFEIPKPQVVENSDDSELDEDTGIEDSADIEGTTNEERTFEEFDFEIFNEDEFLEMMGMPNFKRLQTPQLTYETSEPNNTTDRSSLTQEGENVGTSSYLTPDVYWSQIEKTLKLRIKLIGVSSYKANLIQRRIFTFSTNLEGRSYQLKFTLHKPVEMQRHRALGQEVEVILHKVDNVEWMQLTCTNKRLRYIHYEIPNVKEEKRRKFLDLGISDEESDEDDDKVMFHEISDMDSEFDQEAQDSSSD